MTQVTGVKTTLIKPTSYQQVPCLQIQFPAPYLVPQYHLPASSASPPRGLREIVTRRFITADDDDDDDNAALVSPLDPEDLPAKSCPPKVFLLSLKRSLRSREQYVLTAPLLRFSFVFRHPHPAQCRSVYGSPSLSRKGHGSAFAPVFFGPILKRTLLTQQLLCPSVPPKWFNKKERREEKGERHSLSPSASEI